MAPWVVPVIIAASGIYSAVSGGSQARTRNRWDRYNAQMGYNTTISNIMLQKRITQFNANMLLKKTGMEQAALGSMLAYNSRMLNETTKYNIALLDDKLIDLWEEVDLDVKQIENARARERGTMIADKAASGTVLREGSNAEMIIDQKTQEALDIFIVRHGAEKTAAEIENAKIAASTNRDFTMAKLVGESRMQSFISMSNATLQAEGMIAENLLTSAGALESANYALRAGLSGAGFGLSTGYRQAQNELVGSLFRAGAYTADSHYRSLAID